jgi:hypothetical protein
MAALKPQVRSDLDIAEVDGEAVVYDPRTQELHYLNYSAALVFGFCDGTVTAGEIASGIADAYEVPADEVRQQVDGLLRDIRRKKLLVTGSGQEAAETVDARERIRMEVPRSD